MKQLNYVRLSRLKTRPIYVKVNTVDKQRADVLSGHVAERTQEERDEIRATMREYSGHQILIKPSFLKPFSFLYKSAQPLYPYILISKERCQKALGGDPSSISLLEHEVIHLNRIKQIGIFKWYFLYIFNPKFRLQEEIIAYKQQFKILKKYRISIDLVWYAKVLSSWTYGKMVSFSVAQKLLEETGT